MSKELDVANARIEALKDLIKRAWDHEPDVLPADWYTDVQEELWPENGKTK